MAYLFPYSLGITGAESSTNKCECNENKQGDVKIISDDYFIKSTDYYLGIRCKSPITLSLPIECIDSTEFIIKLEMPAPIGNKKVTILAGDSCNIDGMPSKILKTPYESIRLIYHTGGWHII